MQTLIQNLRFSLRMLAKKSRPDDHRIADRGAGHWRQHRHLYRGLRHTARSPALPATGPTGHGVVQDLGNSSAMESPPATTPTGSARTTPFRISTPPPAALLQHRQQRPAGKHRWRAFHPGLLQHARPSPSFWDATFFPKKAWMARTTKVWILTHKLWSHLGADPKLVGHTMRVNGEPYTVVGVPRPGVSSTEVRAQIAVPLAFKPEQLNHDFHWLVAMGRLKPGVTLQQAQAGHGFRGQPHRGGLSRRATKGGAVDGGAAQERLSPPVNGNRPSLVPSRCGRLHPPDRLRQRGQPSARTRHCAAEGAGGAQRAWRDTQENHLPAAPHRKPAALAGWGRLRHWRGLRHAARPDRYHAAAHAANRGRPAAQSPYFVFYSRGHHPGRASIWQRRRPGTPPASIPARR